MPCAVGASTVKAGRVDRGSDAFGSPGISGGAIIPPRS